MFDWLEDLNNGLRDSLPLMVFATWILVVAIIIKGLVSGEIR